MSKLDILAVKFGEWVIRTRWMVILAVVAIVIAAASGARFLAFDTNYRVFFSADNPQLQAFDQLQRVYTKTDNVVFVLKPNKGTAFSKDVLSAVKELTEESWKLPYSGRVDSITNYQHTYAEGDNLTVVDLVEGDPQDLSKGDLNYIENAVMNEPLLIHNVISEDKKTTGVNVTFNFPQKSIIEVPTTVAAATELKERVEAKYPDIKFVLSGIVALNNAFSTAAQKDMTTLVPVMYLVLLVTMLLFLRSFLATVSTLFVIAFSAAFAMGLAGWAGIRLTPPSVSATTIILTLAIADSIHIIVSMFKAMKAGMEKKEAIIESLRINAQPVFLTSLTTIIGFLALNFSDAPPFHDLGNITAVGVAAAWVFSMLFLPAILSVLPITCKTCDVEEKGSMEKLGEFVIRSKRKLLYSISALIIFLAFMIPKMEIDDQWLQYFDYSIPFRADAEFLIENLTGIYTMQYSIGASEANGVSEPEYLRHLESYVTWLRVQPEVAHVYSITDIFKRLNKNMHGDDPSWHRIPETREMAAQYLLLYEFSLPYGLDLTDRVNVDKSATRVSVTLGGDASTRDIRAFKDRSEKWLRDNTPDYMNAEATSPSVMFAYIADRNIRGMMKGNIISLFLISLIIMISLKSVRMGTISLIPNLVPPIMGFGLWALLIGQVNMAVALVTSISLGIIVDDTVHFLSKYNRAKREKGFDDEAAVAYAFSTVGAALVITTFILIFGFSVLAFSAFKMNSLMGLLTAVIIGCALFADFFLLPPILMLKKKKKESEL